jgi:hypothetical protein
MPSAVPYDCPFPRVSPHFQYLILPYPTELNSSLLPKLHFPGLFSFSCIMHPPIPTVSAPLTPAQRQRAKAARNQLFNLQLREEYELLRLHQLTQMISEAQATVHTYGAVGKHIDVL